ncbi:uncharacterized protein LOC143033465 [Oratosquilla oratoria]|uniref:uncharacterized protein LOC143033465 n=1 Tax=Oratosquilla oratoria TaxID=337810 RepID=UPI003F7645BE
MDPIFTLHMIIEKSWQKLWRTLEYPVYGIPPKLIRAVKSLYNQAYNVVRTVVGEGEWFEVKSGVKQGSGLSPLFLVIFKDVVMSLAQDEHENLATVAYAETIALIARSPGDL